MPAAIASVSAGAVSVGVPTASSVILQAKPVDTTADRAASPPGSGLSHTLAAAPGLVVLAAVVGTMLVAVADKIAPVRWVAQRQAVDLDAWLPLP